MSRRIVIGQGGSSPFLVSAGGDALSADYTGLIFNGNQQPLRLWYKGFVSVPPVPNGAVPVPVVRPDTSGMTFPTPFGTPVFLIVGRNASSSALLSPWHRVNDISVKGLGNGFGGVIANADKRFYGLNFQDPNNAFGYPPVVFDTYVNFAVLRNYG